MDKIYMVRSYFEDFETSTWKIIGIFTDIEQAKEVQKKWENFYIEKQTIFRQPKNWTPSDNDIQFSEEWEESEEYSKRVSDYRDIMSFRDIEIEEFDLNVDFSFNDNSLTDNLRSLMSQWNRNRKLEKIIK